jgi:single-strand DNA-binding protein
MNQAIIIGNLSKDVTMKYLPSGSAVANFSVAVNERYKGKDGVAKDEVDFFDVTCFGTLAENCEKYVAKGSKVLIVGKLKQETWEKDGQKRSRIKIIAQTVQFLSRKEGGNQDAQQEEPLPF